MFVLFFLLAMVSFVSIFVFLIKKKKKKVKYSILITVLSLVLMGATAPPSEKQSETQANTKTTTSSTVAKKAQSVATIKKMIAGDTTVFTYKKANIEVHYLLIDTPEISSNQPYAQEAQERTNELLTNAKKIELTYDDGAHQDTQGRKLMYVWADSELVQETLVKEGLARVETTKNNTKYLKRLQAAEQEAKTARVGIWQADGYVTSTGYDVVAYTTYQETQKLKTTAETAVVKAESEPTRENYQLALAAINAIPNGDTALKQRINNVNSTITAQEKAQQEAVAKAAQEKAAQEKAAQEKAQQEAAAKAAQEKAQQEAAATASNQQSAASGETQYVDASGQGLIKGSVNGIYHTPGSTYYDRTTNVVQWFKTV